LGEGQAGVIRPKITLEDPHPACLLPVSVSVSVHYPPEKMTFQYLPVEEGGEAALPWAARFGGERPPQRLAAFLRPPAPCAMRDETRHPRRIQIAGLRRPGAALDPVISSSTGTRCTRNLERRFRSDMRCSIGPDGEIRPMLNSSRGDKSVGSGTFGGKNSLNFANGSWNSTGALGSRRLG
jgi:hypothetical protein